MTYIKMVNGEPVPMTEAEIIERQAEEAEWELRKDQKPLVEQLDTFFTSNLPEELQADLSPLRAAVKLELEQGRTNIAKLVIERAVIPVELESLRAQLLEMFA